MVPPLLLPSPQILGTQLQLLVVADRLLVLLTLLARLRQTVQSLLHSPSTPTPLPPALVRMEPFLPILPRQEITTPLNLSPLLPTLLIPLQSEEPAGALRYPEPQPSPSPLLL